METTDHLRGPWRAVLANRDGFVWRTYADAVENLADAEEMTISVVRGTALPVEDEEGGEARGAGTYDAGDLIFEIDAYLVDPDDDSCGAEARYAQAQAMADGLNAAAERGETR